MYAGISTPFMKRMVLSWRDLANHRIQLEPKVRNRVFETIYDKQKIAAEQYKIGGQRGVFEWLNSWVMDAELLDLYKRLYSTTATFYARRYFTITMQAVRSLKSAQLVKDGRSMGDVWNEAIDRYTTQHSVRFVTDISAKTRAQIVDVLRRAAAEGWDEASVIMALKDKNVTLARAGRIARTEITRAVSAGAMLAASSVPFRVNKQWITANDERVRGNPGGENSSAPFSHFVLHEVIIPLDSPFFNGEQIRFPADPAASAANVVNCRCALSLVPVTDAQGRPIPKDVNEATILQALSNLL
jgi:Phage Mu protein F like protein